MARILIVEDDPVTVELVRSTLSRADHRLDATDDPSAAVERAAEPGVDAVILDVMLPGRSGFELLEDLRRDPRTADRPILMLTGLGAGRDRIDGLRGGADDYLVKPFEPDELLIRIERLVARPSTPSRKASPTAQREQPSLRSLLRRLEESAAADLDDAVADDAAGAGETPRLGRYEVVDKLAEGGMGTLFLGRDPLLRRRVALKTVRLDRRSASGDADDAETTRLLMQEAILGARVAHPNLVTVFDVGLLADGAFLAMELVEGSNLAALVEGGSSLPAARALPLLASVARGLEAAHRVGVVHRDVKPDNVLLGRDGSVKVSDFGLAALVASLAGGGDAIFGTPGYIAPEVLNGASHDARSDVFALGVMTYRVLSGQKPFRGQTVPAVLVKTLTTEPEALHRLDEPVPRRVSLLVRHMLGKEPEDRPAIGEVAARMEEICGEEGWSWTPESLPETPRMSAATASRVLTSSELPQRG